MKWKLIKRKRVFRSKFINVYEDTVKLPNGHMIDDYTVVEKPDVVIVVAIDSKNKVAVLREYKHAAGNFLLTLPAGHIEDGESPVDAAKRELVEETGYIANRLKLVGVLREYPTKDLHKVYVVKATEIKAKGKQKLEETETFNRVRFASAGDIKKQIAAKKWQASSALSALMISGFLL